MKDLIKHLLREALDKIIKCKNCGWTWKKSESGPDMYFCHKCGHDNTPNNIKETKQDDVLYHGGETKLTTLDPSKIKGGSRAIHGWGVYFSDSINKAKDYGGVITTLDISNLSVLDTEKPVDEELIKKIYELEEKESDTMSSAFYGVIANKLKKEIGKNIDTARKNISDTFKWDISKRWSNMMVALGYDVMKNGYEYVVINLEEASKYLNKTTLQEQKKDEKIASAGVLIKCTETGNILLLLRNEDNPTWSLMAGGIHEGESVLDGLKREFKEELSLEPHDIKFKKIRVEFREDKNRNFHFYHGFTSKEFAPKLDHENKEYGWFSKDKLPSPLYEGMEEKIKTI